MFEPKCPQCGRRSTRTYASFPYAQLECKPCKKVNAEKKSLEERIVALENKSKNKDGE